MKNLIATLALVLFSALATWAANIKGVIIDASNAPVEFVTVSITTNDNPKIIGGGITDIDGSFIIKNIAPGNYTLTCSYMGYKPISIPINITSDKQTADIGKRTMLSDDTELEEVKVTGKASQMRFELDRKVFDATQNIAAEGGSASDLLATVPSVEVDNEGTVSLRGNSSVTIWINGKASGLTSDNQADILQLMPAENIKQIEVITNPSAKYSPEGTAGIINIILKDDKKDGYYGSVKAGADIDGCYNIGGNINATHKKWDFALSLSFRNRNNEGGNETTMLNYAPDGSLVSNLKEKGESNNNHKNIFGRASIGYHFTPNDELVLNASLMKGKGNRDEEIHYRQFGSANTDIDTLYYISTRLTDNNNSNRMYHVELNYSHKWTEDHKINATANTFGWKMDGDASYSQNFWYRDSFRPSSYQLQSTGIDDKFSEIQIDYQNVCAAVVRFEAGYKGSFQRNTSPTTTSTGTNSTDLKLDEGLFNDFTYNQDIHAGYITLGGKIGNLSLQGGLRGEWWQFDTKTYSYAQMSGGLDPDRAKRDFFKLFPSIYVSYALPAGNELQLNYSRRLRRPWGGQLNSFRNISDELNIRFGNPELCPEFTNAFELNYIKMWESGQTFSLSAYLRKTSDAMSRIRFNQGNIMYQTEANVTDYTNSGVELIGKNRIGSHLELTTTVNLFHQKINGYTYAPDADWLLQMTGNPNVDGVIKGDDQNNFNWNARMIANISLPWNVSLQATGNYNAKQNMVQGYRKPVYNLDLGLRKAFFNDKLIFNVSGRNVLNSRKFHSVTEGPAYKQDAKRWRSSSEWNFTLTFNFGNMLKQKPKGPQQGGEGEGEVNYNNFD